MCVGTQCVPGVATCVVAKDLQTHFFHRYRVHGKFWRVNCGRYTSPQRMSIACMARCMPCQHLLLSRCSPRVAFRLNAGLLWVLRH